MCSAPSAQSKMSIHLLMIILLLNLPEYNSLKEISDPLFQEWVDKLTLVDGNDYSDCALHYHGAVDDKKITKGRLVECKNLDVLSSTTFKSFKEAMVMEKEIFDQLTRQNSSWTYTFKNNAIWNENDIFAERINSFFDKLLESKTITMLRDYLKKAGLPEAESAEKFKQWMRQLWLIPKGEAGIKHSVLQHVFFGQRHYGKKLKGLHNWFRYAFLEQQGQIKYEGYLMKPNEAAAFIRFKWENHVKHKGSFLLYTSPELDLAFYTLCHIRSHKDGCQFCYRGCNVNLATVSEVKNSDQLFTAFPAEASCDMPQCKVALK